MFVEALARRILLEQAEAVSGMLKGNWNLCSEKDQVMIKLEFLKGVES